MAYTNVALVTGVGKLRSVWHVVVVLAERCYALVVHYRMSTFEAEETVAYLKSKGVAAVALQADLTDEQAVHRLVLGVLEKFGKLDVLVNCAAIWKAKRLEEVTAADVRLHLETNTLSTFLCTQQAG